MVALNVWPTDGADGSVATEARWRKMGRHWQPTGVCGGVGGEFKPTLAGTNLTVADGAAWVDGHFTELLGSQVLTVTANGIVVVRFDPAANTAELIYRDGVTTPAQSPTGVYEMLVASVAGSVLKDRRTVSFANDTVIFHAQQNADWAMADITGPQSIPWDTVLSDTYNGYSAAAHGWITPRAGWLEVGFNAIVSLPLPNTRPLVHIQVLIYPGGRDYRLCHFTQAGQLEVFGGGGVIQIPVLAGDQVTPAVTISAPGGKIMNGGGFTRWTMRYIG